MLKHPILPTRTFGHVPSIASSSIACYFIFIDHGIHDDRLAQLLSHHDMPPPSPSQNRLIKFALVSAMYKPQT